MKNISRYNLNENILRKVTVNIGLEGIIVKILLDSSAMGLVISSEFTRKQRFNFLKIKKLVYVRNIDCIFNKERIIEYIVKVNIFYKEHREKTEIDIIKDKIECNLRNTIACLPQSWDWLENKRDQDNKMSKGVWKVVKTKTRKIRNSKTKRNKRKKEKDRKQEENENMKKKI